MLVIVSVSCRRRRRRRRIIVICGRKKLKKMKQGMLTLSVFTTISTAMICNKTCNNSAECLEGLVCKKQICVDGPVLKRHSRSFLDRSKALCVIPLVCFP
ncbi:Protein CBG04533 [Caenorhabditis briggsae]|uniref:Protein CBG04533 n=1 Tax=Caenorhabditis briggsae TaxID=6238 RepID=A8WXN4_CAEBR|nr:Protein CBG04533 [Caenorhabditis briggsae]CAP25167.1 Protein CBG04533 [Caenorhabditis briggsae]